MKKLLSLVILACLMVSCKSSISLQSKAEAFAAMQSATGTVAGPPGSPLSYKTWTVEKAVTSFGGNWVVFKRVDNTSSAVSYIAYDLDSYNMETLTATFEANAQANFVGDWFIRVAPDVGGTFKHYTGGHTAAFGVGGTYEVVANPGNYTFEENTATGKDLEAMGAKLENQITVSWAKNLSENFGMSDERSHEVAKIVQNWNNLKKQRNVTEKDWNVLSQKLIGVDYKKASAAIEGSMNGNGEELTALLEKAADFNGVTPEQMELVLNDLIVNN